MGWTSPNTWVANSVLTAEDMNVYVSDNLSHLYNNIGSIADGGIINRGAMPEGSVIQTVSASTTQSVSNSSNSFVDSGLSATITPTSADSKILVIASQVFYSRDFYAVRVLRGSTVIHTPTDFENGVSTGTFSMLRVVLPVIDSPNTTSAVTYKTQFRRDEAYTTTSNHAGAKGYMYLIEVKG